MDALTDPQYKSVDGAAVRIWRDPAPNKFMTESLGRAMFDDVIFCEVITPGSKDSTPIFELERTFCEEAGIPTPRRSVKYAEFAALIEAFKKDDNSDASLAGTPLSQWPEMNRSLVASLRAHGIFTVDALANLPDTKLVAVGPDGRSWRAKAAAYLEAARNSGYATKLAADLEKAEVDKQALADQVKALAARVQELETSALTGKTPKAPPAAQGAKDGII